MCTPVHRSLGSQIIVIIIDGWNWRRYGEARSTGDEKLMVLPGRTSRGSLSFPVSLSLPLFSIFGRRLRRNLAVAGTRAATSRPKTGSLPRWLCFFFIPCPVFRFPVGLLLVQRSSETTLVTTYRISSLRPLSTPRFSPCLSRAQQPRAFFARTVVSVLDCPINRLIGYWPSFRGLCGCCRSVLPYKVTFLSARIELLFVFDVVAAHIVDH